MTTGRVIEAHRTNFKVKTDRGVYLATVRGNFHHEGDFPKVGDRVELSTLDTEKAVIERVCERHSVIKRKAPDKEEEQIIVANVDLILIVMGLDGDYSLSRLERYLLLAEQSEIEAVVLLNKLDVVEDGVTYLDEVSRMANKWPIIMISALTGENMDELLKYLPSGKTAVLLGSSGAGKSTITNWLLDEERQAVKEIRGDDSHGRHTTTSRQLFDLPNGSYLIDTPGMRELGVIEADQADEARVFEKIENLAKQCKFRNCEHEKSSGCAVITAVEEGEITARELKNYYKLQKEIDFQNSKGSDALERHHQQNQKRLQQKNAAIQRQKLSRRLQ